MPQHYVNDAAEDFRVRYRRCVELPRAGEIVCVRINMRTAVEFREHLSSGMTPYEFSRPALWRVVNVSKRFVELENVRSGVRSCVRVWDFINRGIQYGVVGRASDCKKVSDESMLQSIVDTDKVRGFVYDIIAHRRVE